MSISSIVAVGPFPEDPAFVKGGVQASVYGLSRALHARDDVGRVAVISIPVTGGGARSERSAVVDGIEVTYFDAPYSFLASSVLHVSRILRRITEFENPVVHVHGTGLLQAALCASLQWRNVPFVWTLHGITAKETLQKFRERHTFANACRHLFYACLERFCLHVAHDIVVDTGYVKAEIPFARGDIHVLPVGTFTQDYAALALLKRTEPLIACIGVMDPRKGHHLTLEAFAAIRRAVPGARLVLAGSATVPSYLQHLRENALALGIAQDVEFLVDCPRSALVALLARARVFALHSQEESQGIVFCEAMAAGVPVVATRAGGIPFVVEEGRDGFLVAHGDVNGFADAVVRLLTDDALHACISAHAVRSAARFDWSRIAEEAVQIYGKAISRI